MSKINKALDLNKLFIDQKNGKLLKKQLSFPLYAPIKYDGNYTVTEVLNGKIVHTTSGGLNYKHTDDYGDIFKFCMDGYYLAERIAKEGKLGQRRYCALTGPKKDQKATKHSYKVFGFVSVDDYVKGVSKVRYPDMLAQLLLSGVPHEHIVETPLIFSMAELDDYLTNVVKAGYEGVMAVSPNWCWKDTKSRNIDFCKYKKRPTVDLLCIGVEEGEGKYEGMIGALVLRDSQGRIVSVGSGMSDEDRTMEDYFVGKVVEVFYEQIIHTYIQPTFGNEYEGVLVRHDKTEKDID